MLFRLAWNQLFARPVRTWLTVLAVAMAVALVVSVTSGYASLENTIRTFAQKMMGGMDVELTSSAVGTPGVPRTLLNDLRVDPRVNAAWGRLEASRRPHDSNGNLIGQVAIKLIGVDLQHDVNVNLLQVREGKWFGPNDKRKIVIDLVVSEALGRTVGQTIQFPGKDGLIEYEIAGIVHKPRILGVMVQSLYMPMDDLRELAAIDNDELLKIQAEFKIKVDAKQFLDDWQAKVEATGKPVDIRLTRETRDDLDRNLLAMRIMSMIGSAIALLAAMFIVFTTLSMGVMERQRILAMFRAIGGMRHQVVLLVLIEAILIAVLGVVIGVPLGVLGVYFITLFFKTVFAMGVAISASGIAFAAVVSLLSATVASLLPAWRASRVDPLAAMRPAVENSGNGLPWKSLLLGLVLISLDTLIVTFPVEFLGLERGEVVDRELRLLLHFGIGLPAVFVGFFLVSPMVVVMFEKLFAPLIAWSMRVPVQLLREQFSGALWRAAGTATALMVGLAVLIVMRTQGHSALSSWQIPTKFPDLVLYTDQLGPSFTAEMVDKVRTVPGVIPDRVLPVAVTFPGLGQDVFRLAAGRMPEATVFVGIDPIAAEHMVELDFRQGDAQTTTRMLDRGRQITLNDGRVLHGTVESSDAASLVLQTMQNSRLTLNVSEIKENKPGRYLVVTQEFYKLRNLGVGQTFTLTRGLLRSQRFDYTIVAVIWSPGVELIINSFDLQGQMERQTASAVFGTIDSAVNDLGADGARLVAFNATTGLERDMILSRVQQQLGDRSITIADIRAVKYQITNLFSYVLLLASTVAWSAMAVSALGVTNAIVASVRSRTWQLGILRAIGLSRGTMGRLLLVEGVALGVMGCMIGLAAGLLLSFNVRKFSAAMIGFDPPIVVPWGVVVIGCLGVLLLSLIATLGPALHSARKPVLNLLSAGRSGI
jgi:putative ABC transport system permease protein